MKNRRKRESDIVHGWMRLAPVLLLLAGPCLLVAQSKPPAEISDIGGHHHIISTKSTEAQRFFDRGLTLVFAFNHEEAVRAFQ
jgi:hypothetical protein